LGGFQKEIIETAGLPLALNSFVISGEEAKDIYGTPRVNHRANTLYIQNVGRATEMREGSCTRKLCQDEGFMLHRDGPFAIRILHRFIRVQRSTSNESLDMPGAQAIKKG
jgi:hypothetical protein